MGFRICDTRIALEGVMKTTLKLESNGTVVTLVIDDSFNNDPEELKKHEARDLAEIKKLVLTLSEELAAASNALAPAQCMAMEQAVGKLQTCLAGPNPDSSVIKGILSSVRNILEEAAGGILADNWLTVLTFLKTII
jgi:hypothetical protein